MFCDVLLESRRLRSRAPQYVRRHVRKKVSGSVSNLVSRSPIPRAANLPSSRRYLLTYLLAYLLTVQPTLLTSSASGPSTFMSIK